MESKLVSLALRFWKGKRYRSPKGALWHCASTEDLYQYLFSLTARQPKRITAFPRKGKQQEQPSAPVLQRALPEAVRSPSGKHTSLSARDAAAGTGGREPLCSLSMHSAPLLPGSNGFSALPRLSLKLVLPSTTEAGRHLSRDTTGSPSVTRRASARRGGGASAAKGASVRSEGPRTRGQLILPSSFIST